ncbi:MAG TPA: hypothetical protein VHT73_14950 [Thermodesulfobacteriota bacterium]|nr:hypothetical protein [Thermodesulfobacteriota bacterium]
MAETKVRKEANATDFVDFFKSLNELMKENYDLGVKTSMALWEESQKFANAQLDHFFNIQREYTNQMKANLQRLPNEVSIFWNNNYLNGNYERITGAQRDYINSVRKVSEKFTKEALNLSQKTTEKTLSALEDYMNLFKS